MGWQEGSEALEGRDVCIITADLHCCMAETPGGSEVKESACNAGDLGSILGSGRSPEDPPAVLLPGKSHGQRSLVGYSPWGHRVGHD